ncbi:MAG: PAS domain-containing sensor histidine kinase [Ferruginibacter sp.]
MPVRQDPDFWLQLLEVYSTNNGEFIGVVNSDTGTLIWVNQMGARLFGFADSSELLAAESTGFVSSQFSTTIQGAAKKISFQKSDKSTFTSTIIVSPFYGDDRHYLLIRIKNPDIAGIYHPELNSEKERFEALFNFATIGILVTDKQGDIVLANKFAAFQFGYEENELTGKKIDALIPARLRERHVQHRENYNENPHPRNMGSGMNLFALKKDQTEFAVEVSLSNYTNEEDFFVIAFVIDVTRRKQTEDAMLFQQKELEKVNAEIEKLNSELEQKVESRTLALQQVMLQLESSKEELTKALSQEKELNELKSRFVSMASHEFRTPLSTILSSASLLAKYTETTEQEKRNKHIDRIKSSVNNLTDILDEFLSIGKIEDGKITAHSNSFDVSECIQEICNEMFSHTKKGQQIKYVHKGEVTVLLDVSLLRNVIINLLSNAIKFSSESSKIFVYTFVNEYEFVLKIKDSGIGISLEDQEHLFEMFFRASNATNIQGTGLGLHIVTKYVELMNGEIHFNSELEKGTEFIITLPFNENLKT